MNYPFLSGITIKTADDARSYLRVLIQHRLEYHLDDAPGDIVFNAPAVAPTAEDIAQMERLHDELWAFDPWVIFEQDRKLFDEYTGQG